MLWVCSPPMQILLEKKSAKTLGQVTKTALLLSCTVVPPAWSEKEPSSFKLSEFQIRWADEQMRDRSVILRTVWINLNFKLSIFKQAWPTCSGTDLYGLWQIAPSWSELPWVRGLQNLCEPKPNAHGAPLQVFNFSTTATLSAMTSVKVGPGLSQQAIPNENIYFDSSMQNYISMSDLHVISTRLRFILDFGFSMFGLTGTHLLSFERNFGSCMHAERLLQIDSTDWFAQIVAKLEYLCPELSFFLENEVDGSEGFYASIIAESFCMLNSKFGLQGQN